MARSNRNFTAVALTVAALASSPASAGFVMKQTQRADGDASQMASMTTRMSVDAGGVKMEFLESANPMMPVGSYLLMRPDDDAMILVNPEKKTWSSFDLGAMMNTVGAMSAGGPGGAAGGAMEQEYSDPIIEKLLEEDGGTILGRPTKHYRFRLRWALTLKMPMGMSMIVETDSTEDVWVSTSPLDAKTLRALSNLGTGMTVPPALQKLIDARREMEPGLPLKRIDVSTSKTTGTGMMAKLMERGNKESGKPVTMTTEVVELSEESLPASVFAIPAGYTETDLMSPGMQMPEMNRRN